MQLSQSRQRNTSATLRLGGVACALGGIIWIALVIAVQLQMLRIMNFYEVPDPPCCDQTRPYSLTNAILTLPLFFFLRGLEGLFQFARQRQALNTLGKVGFISALCGIILSLLSIPFADYWPAWLGGPWWYGSYGGLFEPYQPPLGLLWLLWFASFGPGLVILAVGLLLITFSIMKARVLAIWSIVGLIVASVAVVAMPFAAKALLLFTTGMDEPQYYSGVFVALLVPFGLGWILAGFDLLGHADVYHVKSRVRRVKLEI